METKSKQNGLRAEKLVKEQLWRNGYSVKDVSRFANYDLLVDEKLKVEVKSAEYQQLKEGIVWKFTNIRIKPETPDVLAVVVTTPLKDTLIFYTKWTTEVIKSFDLSGVMYGDQVKNGNRVTCSLRVTPDTLKQCFTDSPAAVLKN